MTNPETFLSRNQRAAIERIVIAQGKPCGGCGEKFYPTKHELAHPSHFGGRKYCSNKCMLTHIDNSKPKSEAEKKRLREAGYKYGFKKGYTPHNRGKSFITPGSFKKGMTPWNKGVPNPNFRGEKNPKWRGGITPINSAIRHSLEYVAWRREVFERDNYTCVLCGERGGNLNADHIKPFADFPELRMELDNGRTLCVPCHRKTPTYGNRVVA